MRGVSTFASAGRVARTVRLSALLIGLAAIVAFAQSDPLPSWNEGAAKRPRRRAGPSST